MAVGAAGVFVLGTAGGMIMQQTQKACASPPSDATRKDVWDQIAAKYDREIASHESSLGIDDLRKELVALARGRVLELAAGTGRNLPFYSPAQCSEVRITDRSGAMLEEARQALARQEGRAGAPPGLARAVVFEECDASKERLPYADDAFDTVVDTFGLCSYDEPAHVLAEMRRVARPGGRVLLLEHGRSRFSLLTRYLDWRAPCHAAHWGCWWNRDIEALVRGADMEVERLETHHMGTSYLVVLRKGGGAAPTE
jgi:methyltransferase OMS1